MKRTTIFLKEEVHARLRQEAHKANLSMAELIRRKLDVADSAADVADWKPPKPNPLRELAGMWSDGTLTANLDEELYDL
jgi:hypothetical protein